MPRYLKIRKMTCHSKSTNRAFQVHTPDVFRIFLLIFSPVLALNAQQLTGLSTKWDDSFSEWLIYTDDENLTGELVMRWPLQNDWSEWDYRLGEYSGSIRVKWKGDPNLWELRGGNELITIRSVFKDDFRQWEVKSSRLSIDIKSKWGNIFEEWVARKESYGQLEMFTAWEGDLRDWVVEDQLNTDISLHFKLAMSFIPVLYAVPKH